MADEDGGARVRELRARERERLEGRKVVRPLPGRLTTKVVGVTFPTFEDGSPAYPTNVNRLEQLAAVRLWRGEELEPIACVLIRKPDNAADANAVEVHVPGVVEQDERIPLGHVPATIALRLAPELDAGTHWRAAITQVVVHPEHPDRPGVELRLTRLAE